MLRAASGVAALAGHIFAAYALNRMKQNNPYVSLKPMKRDPSSGSAEPLFISDLEELRDSDTKDAKIEDLASSQSVHSAVRSVPTRGRTAQTWHERTYKLGRPNSLLARGRVIFVTFATHTPLFDAFLLDVPDDANQLLRIL